MSQGNNRLIKHGIDEDESDFRIHVGFLNARAYVFPTQAARDAIHNGHNYPRWEASQKGTSIVTGAGFYVPPRDIAGCYEVRIPADVMIECQPQRGAGTSRKGADAARAAKALFERGLIRLPFEAREINDYELQIRGIDLMVSSSFTVQVKCDNRCARRGLAIQTHECNPRRRI